MRLERGERGADRASPAGSRRALAPRPPSSPCPAPRALRNALIQPPRRRRASAPAACANSRCSALARGEKRGHRLGGGVLTRRRRSREIAPDRRRDRRQRAVADIGARIEIERPARDLGRRARKHVGHDRFGLDDAGVAEARLARGLGMTVDERDRSAARLKMQARPRRRQIRRRARLRRQLCEGMASQSAPLALSSWEDRPCVARNAAPAPRFSTAVPIDPAANEQTKSSLAHDPRAIPAPR